MRLRLFLLIGLTMASLGASADTTPYKITLHRFAAATGPEGTRLSWKVARHAEVAYLIVQYRTSAAAEWLPLTTVPANAAHYLAPTAGEFRLVTMDHGGLPAFSRVLAVR